MALFSFILLQLFLFVSGHPNNRGKTLRPLGGVWDAELDKSNWRERRLFDFHSVSTRVTLTYDLRAISTIEVSYRCNLGGASKEVGEGALIPLAIRSKRVGTTKVDCGICASSGSDKIGQACRLELLIAFNGEQDSLGSKELKFGVFEGDTYNMEYYETFPTEMSIPYLFTPKEISTNNIIGFDSKIKLGQLDYTDYYVFRYPATTDKLEDLTYTLTACPNYIPTDGVPNKVRDKDLCEFFKGEQAQTTSIRGIYNYNIGSNVGAGTRSVVYYFVGLSNPNHDFYLYSFTYIPFAPTSPTYLLDYGTPRYMILEDSISDSETTYFPGELNVALCVMPCVKPASTEEEEEEDKVTCKSSIYEIMQSLASEGEEEETESNRFWRIKPKERLHYQASIGINNDSEFRPPAPNQVAVPLYSESICIVTPIIDTTKGIVTTVIQNDNVAVGVAACTCALYPLQLKRTLGIEMDLGPYHPVCFVVPSTESVVFATINNDSLYIDSAGGASSSDPIPITSATSSTSSNGYSRELTAVFSATFFREKGEEEEEGDYELRRVIVRACNGTERSFVNFCGIYGSFGAESAGILVLHIDSPDYSTFINVYTNDRKELTLGVRLTNVVELSVRSPSITITDDENFIFLVDTNDVNSKIDGVRLSLGSMTLKEVEDTETEEDNGEEENKKEEKDNTGAVYVSLINVNPCVRSSQSLTKTQSVTENRCDSLPNTKLVKVSAEGTDVKFGQLLPRWNTSTLVSIAPPKLKDVALTVVCGTLSCGDEHNHIEMDEKKPAKFKLANGASVSDASVQVMMTVDFPIPKYWSCSVGDYDDNAYFKFGLYVQKIEHEGKLNPCEVKYSENYVYKEDISEFVKWDVEIEEEKQEKQEKQEGKKNLRCRAEFEVPRSKAVYVIYVEEATSQVGTVFGPFKASPLNYPDSIIIILSICCFFVLLTAGCIIAIIIFLKRQKEESRRLQESEDELSASATFSA